MSASTSWDGGFGKRTSEWTDIREMSRLPGELELDKIQLVAEKANLSARTLMAVATAFSAVGMELDAQQKLKVFARIMSGESLDYILLEKVGKKT